MTNPVEFPENYDDVDDFLEHHGIKGMKWGVQKSQEGISSVVRRVPKSDAERALARSRAVTAGKIALTAVKIGAPAAAAALGVGLPVAALAGISMRVLSDPAVQSAISTAGSYAHEVSKDFSNVSMQTIREIKSNVNIKSPFTVKVTSIDGTGYKGPREWWLRDENGHYQPRSISGGKIPGPLKNYPS